MNHPTPYLLLALSFLFSGCAADAPAGQEPEQETYEVLATQEVGGAATISSRVALVIERVLEGGEDLQVLAVSGGGQNGAFGAGVLRGWGQKRPHFQLVTGVSTGSFIATRAFIGSEMSDLELQVMYTSTGPDEVMDFELHLLPFTGSLSSDERLRELIARWFPDRLIDQVALASQGGERVLLVGTTNLAQGRLQFWDMSLLARGKHYGAFRRVLLASASIPLLCPTVEIAGETHVDGGVRQHVFTPYGFLTDNQQSELKERAKELDWQGQARVWVLVNAALGLLPGRVDSGGVDVSVRCVAALLDASLEGNLWRVWGQAELDEIQFRMLSIPQEHLEAASDSTAFDRKQMLILFNAGLEAGQDPKAWRTRPPPPAFGRAILGGSTDPLPRRGR